MLFIKRLNEMAANTPDDNLSRQVDEIEALTAIYGDDWCVVDPVDRVYCIQVTDAQEPVVLTIRLQVIFPVDYPSSSPPQYQLNAPWLRGPEKQELANTLEELYCENIGESIIYLWVEKIRDFVVAWSDSQDPDKVVPTERTVIVSEEIDENYSDDSFDASKIEMDPKHMQLDFANGKDVELPEIFHSGAVTDRKSTFQPHLAPVTCTKQVKMVMDKLRENKKIDSATHNIYAYRIEQEAGCSNFYQGCEDDGEIHAGSRMLHLLQIVDARNVLVVVSRWYGGIHLGPDRFKHINSCTRRILEEQDFLKDREEKKGPKSSKKGK